MPTTQEHVEKQNSIRITPSYLQQSQNRSQHADWIVTLAFYKALHAVDSYFAKQGIDPEGHLKGHGRRQQQVRNYLEGIHEEYSALYTASILARYEEYTHEPSRGCNASQ